MPQPPDPVISPSPRSAWRLRTARTHVIATVTTVAEAEAAAGLGSDGLCVQRPDAGGHRATCHVDDEQESIPQENLVKAVSLPTDAPIIAAGEVRMGDQVADLPERGATAVQLGTAFPRSPESGAKPAPKDALVSGQLTHIVGTLVLWASCEMTAQQLRWRT
jgi:NAD(P)H-dependent flavin oxidoreductase YrpB (nitropropane dioxygenase family)